MVVAQLVERSPPIPKVRGSNPDIGKIYIEHLFTVSIEKTKIKEKEAGNCPFFLKKLLLSAKAGRPGQRAVYFFRCL